MKLIPQPHHAHSLSFLDELNPEQQKAAMHINGPLLIIAGAGSGKTKTLTYRIAYALSQGVQSSSILALTFTNKAAEEMKSRISTLIGATQAKSIWAGTFHSIFARILRFEAEHIGFTSSFSIYDTDDSLSMIRSVMRDAGISAQQFTPQSIKGRISHAKNLMISWQEYEASSQDINEKQTALVYKEYEKRLRLNNAMDFDDILLNIIRLLQLSPEIKAKYQQRFSLIMVDEYQDTNRAQYIAVNLLAGGHRNLCVVGDDAQSIYRWRGADIRNILDFQKDYPDAEIVKLEQNYRSTKVILSAADSIISKNRKQLKKTLWTDNPQGDLIKVIETRDDREEADAIKSMIKHELTHNGISAKDIAILYRTNAQSLSLEDALRSSRIGYTIIGGVSFYKRKEVKDTIAYLRLLCNPSDSESLTRIINEPARGIGPSTLKKLNEYAQSQSIALFTAFEQANTLPDLQKRAVQASFDFTTMIHRFTELKSSLPPHELAKEYIEATGLLRMFKDEDTEESLDRWNNVQRMLSNIEEEYEKDSALTIEEFLQTVALMSDIDETDMGQERIAMMTMHAAKGLEFPVVFIAGLEQGLFPMGRAEHDPDEQEEERRLFYVGITRAEQRLYLSYAQRRYRFGELNFSQPSMFLRELHPDTIEYVDTYGTSRSVRTPEIISSRQTKYGSGIQKSKPSPFFEDIPPAEESFSQVEPEGYDIRTGMKVMHGKFGKGTVQSVSGNGEKREAIVIFEGIGKKQLLLKYAKLQPYNS
ncbi:MAG: ATP-dependent helicase [Candidatus Kapaibacteriota bacterium]